MALSKFQANLPRRASGRLDSNFNGQANFSSLFANFYLRFTNCFDIIPPMIHLLFES